MPGIETGYYQLRPRQIPSPESPQVVAGEPFFFPLPPVFSELSEPSEPQQRRQIFVVAVESVVILAPVRLRERGRESFVVDLAEVIGTGEQPCAAHASEDTADRR